MMGGGFFDLLVSPGSQLSISFFNIYIGHVYPAYNPSFSACFFSAGTIFFSHNKSGNSILVGLSAQPNGAIVHRVFF
jgi:hypothetical protein